jgi:hypothetical protein
VNAEFECDLKLVGVTVESRYGDEDSARMDRGDCAREAALAATEHDDVRSNRGRG